MKKLALNNVEKVLESVKEIKGSRNVEIILDNMESIFIDEVDIVRNESFELSFNTRNRECVLKTTYSNQVIDQDFISEMNKLNQAKELIGFALKQYIEVDGERPMSNYLLGKIENALNEINVDYKTNYDRGCVTVNNIEFYNQDELDDYIVANNN